MPLSEPIQLRLNSEKKFIYQAEAAARCMSLSTYLRERLEQDDQMIDSLNLLKQDLKQDSNPSSSLHEILLLLRSLAGPDNVKRVQAELKRSG